VRVAVFQAARVRCDAGGTSVQRAAGALLPCVLRRRWHAASGFTLVETLVVVAVISLLIAILLPAMHSAREQMRTLSCSSNLKKSAFEFQIFANGESPSGRGDSDERFGESSGKFQVEDFLESQYGVGEFWTHDDVPWITLPPNHPLVCPSTTDELKTRGQALDDNDAVYPAEAVSVAINMRLYRSVFEFAGQQRLQQAKYCALTARTMEHPFAPLLIEVDGAAAQRKVDNPLYIAPPLAGRDDPYSDGAFWSPGQRHGGGTLVGFVGGHVLRSQTPEQESWDWGYQAETAR